MFKFRADRKSRTAPPTGRLMQRVNMPLSEHRSPFPARFFVRVLEAANQAAPDYLPAPSPLLSY